VKEDWTDARDCHRGRLWRFCTRTWPAGNGAGAPDIDALLAEVLEHLDPVIAGLRSLDGDRVAPN